MVGAPKYGVLKKNFPHSLNQAPFIHFTPHSQLRLEVDKLLNLNKIIPNVVCEVDDFKLARLFIEKGSGVGYLPKDSILESLELKKLIQIGESKNIHADIWVVHTYSGKLSPYLSRLFAMAK